MAEPQFKKSKFGYGGWKHQGKPKQFSLQVGLKGFMCTCNFSEKGCIREALNLLNLYADRLYPAELEVEEKPTQTPGDDDVDVTEELEKEINTLKAEKNKTVAQRKFQIIESGAKNCLFIRTTVADPVHLATHIAQDILQSKEQQTRDLLRLVPIEIVCKATVASIGEYIGSVLDKHFKDSKKSFGIVFNHRNNNSINRDEVIAKVAELVVERNPDHKVDLKNPDISIVIEVIRAWCLIAVLPDYNKLKRYNLLELSAK